MVGCDSRGKRDGITLRDRLMDRQEQINTYFLSGLARYKSNYVQRKRIKEKEW